MAIEKLNTHYSMQNTPTIYDEEALTTLELAARTTGKVNEVVEAQNELHQNTEKHLSDQDNEIAERTAAQDQAIQRMNDVTMPAKVKQEMQRRIDDGTFDTNINAYAGNLIQRMETLEGAVSAGSVSSSSDAELVGIRVGYDNKEHPTAGTAVREQIAGIHRKFNQGLPLSDMGFSRTGRQLFDKTDPDNIIGGYIQTTGVYFESEIHFQTHLIPVIPGEKYCSNVCTAFVLWFDNLKNLIGDTPSGDFRVNKYVIPPENAAYARFIGYLTDTTDDYYNITNIDNYGVWEGEYDKGLPYEFNRFIPGVNAGSIPVRLLDIVENNSVNIIDKNAADIVLGGYYNNSGIYKENENIVQSGLTHVTPGKEYTASDKSVLVNFYDEHGNHLIGYHSSRWNENEKGTITAPENACYARFGCYLANWPSFMVVEGDTLPASYVPGNYKIKSVYLPESSYNLGMRFTSYGDSITARNTWQPAIAEYFGITHTCHGIGSTTMAYVESVEDTLPCMVNAARIQQLKDSNPDIVTILGGANDAVRSVPVGTSAELSYDISSKDITTYFGALSYLVETLLTWKPTLNIILMTPTLTNVVGYRDIYTKYAEAVRDVAAYYGVALADTHRESGITAFNTSTYTSDGVHLNAAGSLRFANVVGAKIADLYRIR